MARQPGISRGTVSRALSSDQPPKYRRPLKGSAVDTVEPAVRELLKQAPTMPVTVIAERIGRERGLTISPTPAGAVRSHPGAPAARGR